MSTLQLGKASKNYLTAQPYVKMMRDTVTGVPALKAPENATTYLPKIDCDDEQDAEYQRTKYQRILKQAEYNNVPSRTLSALQGGLSYRDNNFEGVPSELEYLLDDIDGDGLTANELIKIVQSELLQVKYCGLLAEYSDLESLGIDEDEQLTITQKNALGLRASIKLYSRESIVNWDFKRINGRRQLSWVLLREVEQDKDPLQFSCDDVETYVLLSLDDDGNYNQRRWVEGETKQAGGWSEAVYPEKSGGMLFSYIPFEFVIEGDYPKGDIPLALGYLFEIAGLTLHRYQMSACYKSALHYMATPKTWSSGWDNQGFEFYKSMTGRDYISIADDAHLPLPKDGQYGILDWKASDTAYRDYFDSNAAEIEAQGGTFDIQENSGEQTATAKVINAAEKTSVLSNIQATIETALIKLMTHCADFEGREAEVDIKLNREFIAIKLSPQERDAIRNDYGQGLITREEALKQLEQGGVLVGKAEELLVELEMNGQ